MTNPAPHPDDTPMPSLPARPTDSHKGTFGTVLVIGGHAGKPGEPRMIGAPALAGTAALRSGAGLVKMLVPEPIAGSTLEICPSATAVGLPTDTSGQLVPHEAAEILDRELLKASAIVIGPGMGTGHPVEQLVYRALQQDECPVVLDADGLNAIAGLGITAEEVRAPTVLTPHPGEYSRLAECLKINLSPTDPETRGEACASMARSLGCVCVLKGARTVVSDGHRAWTCSSGHPCLATGGTGDVLAGLIGGLIAQHVDRTLRTGSRSLFECAQIAVEAHARAGESWAAEHGASAGVLALELAERLPGELERFRSVD